MADDEKYHLGNMVTEHYSNVPHETLYHYTSTANLLSIVAQRELWATEIRYLNDIQEMSFFTETLRVVSEKMVLQTDQEREVRGQFVEWLQETVSDNGSLVFVISLSERGNLLSQWRSYTRVGQGLSLGFKADCLLRLCEMQKFRIGKCIYNKHAAEEVCARIARLVISFAAHKGPGAANGARDDQTYVHAFQFLERAILSIGALYKHDAFVEEREWRIVSSVKPFYDTGPDISHRAGLTAIVPYQKFGLKVGEFAEESSGPVERVYVGPTPDYQRSMSSVSRVVVRSGLMAHGGLTVTYCDIPLRNV